MGNLFNSDNVAVTNLDCPVCPIGWYGHDARVSDCTRCEAGKYQDQTDNPNTKAYAKTDSILKEAQQTSELPGVYVFFQVEKKIIKLILKRFECHPKNQVQFPIHFYHFVSSNHKQHV